MVSLECLLCMLRALAVGPRFVMNLIKIFDGSFGGPTLYENPHYVPPNMVSTAMELLGRSGRLVLSSSHSRLPFNFNVLGPVQSQCIATCVRTVLCVCFIVCVVVSTALEEEGWFEIQGQSGVKKGVGRAHEGLGI